MVADSDRYPGRQMGRRTVARPDMRESCERCSYIGRSEARCSRDGYAMPKCCAGVDGSQHISDA